MQIVDKLLERLGYIKSTTWGKLWLTAKEWQLIGENKATQPYKQVASVYKAVKAIADNVPQAELIFKDWESEKEVYPKELIALFEKPNRRQSGNDFMQELVGYYALYGECFIIKNNSIGQETGKGVRLPSELYAYNPARMKERVDRETGELTGWKYGNADIPLESVIHIKDFNPYDEHRGLSPLYPLEKIIDTDWASTIYNKVFFDNDGTPGFMLSTEKNLTPDQHKRLQEWWEKRHKGVQKAFKVAVLEAGLKPVSNASTHKDMDFIEQKKHTREEILGTWRAPKALFNITDDLNYATFMGQMKIFWLYAIAPILTKIEYALTNHIVAPFNSKVYCEFDYRNVPAFQEDFKEKVDIATKLFALGIPLREINEKLELGFKPEGLLDEGLVPFSLAPVSQVTAEPEIPPPDETIPPVSDDDEEEEKIIEPKALHKSKVQRQLIWKKFVNRHAVLEIRFANSLKRYFYEQRRRVLQAVTQKSVKEISLGVNWDKENAELLKYATPYLLNGIEQGVSMGKDLLNTFVTDETIRHRIQAYLSIRCSKIQSINKTILQQLNAAMGEGISAGETITQLSDRIRSIYNMATARSRTIARTETTASMNGGSILYYNEVGVKQKQWTTAGDEMVRITHLEIDGEIVDIGKRFSNGLDMPGGDGAPEEVINCRCTVVPVVEE